MAHALREVESGVLVDPALAQHHELVAADTGDDVGWSCCQGEPAGKARQQPVPDLVTRMVVDVLQPESTSRKG